MTSTQSRVVYWCRLGAAQQRALLYLADLRPFAEGRPTGDGHRRRTYVTLEMIGLVWVADIDGGARDTNCRAITRHGWAGLTSAGQELVDAYLDAKAAVDGASAGREYRAMELKRDADAAHARVEGHMLDRQIAQALR